MTSDSQESAPPPESVATSSATSSATDTAKARIKIGTQRQGVAAPRVPPRVKTIFQTPEPGQESAASEPTAAAVAAQPGTESPTEPTAAASSSAAAATPAEPAAPDLFPKPTPIAPTQRKNKFDIVERAGEKVAPPNLRAELTPDLAEELDAALEGVSLNDLMSAERADAASGDPLEPETKTRGKVIRLHNEDVFVELPGRNQGVVSLKQFAESPAPAAMIDVVVTRFNADEGLHELTLPGGAVSVEDWSQVAEGMVVEAHVTGHNKGGWNATSAGSAVSSRSARWHSTAWKTRTIRRPEAHVSCDRGRSRAANSCSATGPCWSRSKPRRRRSCWPNWLPDKSAKAWCATSATSARLSIWGASMVCCTSVSLVGIASSIPATCCTSARRSA